MEYSWQHLFLNNCVYCLAQIVALKLHITFSRGIVINCGFHQDRWKSFLLKWINFFNEHSRMLLIGIDYLLGK